MTIQWGGWEYSGSNGMRVGVEVTSSQVVSGSVNVLFTFKVYTQNQYRYDDNQTLTYGGTAGSGTTDYLNSTSSTSAILRATRTYTYTYSTYGSSPGTRTFTAAVSGTYNGVTPSVGITVTIPARPYALPAAVTGVTATRNSDDQATVSWTSHATSAAPYTSLTVQMRTLTGSTWSAWSTAASTTAGATSYVKSGLSANHVYQFQVRANNTAGSSAYAASGYVPMTPAAPSDVVASITSAGTSISLTWDDNAYTYATNPITFSVQRSVAGGAWASQVTGIAQATHAWTDPSPGAGTNQYRVAAVQSVGTLTSDWADTGAQSNIVSTIVPPLAPTLLSPNGIGADLARNLTLSWKHNHGGDFAPQTHFTIERSSNGGATWSPVATNVASSTQSYTLPANTLSNGSVYQWHVKTEGVTSVGFGPFSSVATLTGSATPTVTLSLPEAATNTMPLTAAWSYNQDQLSPQAAWQATLYAADGTTILETRSGSGTTSSVAFTYAAVDGSTYVVAVRAQSGAGLWSDWTTASTDFVLLPPAAAVLTATFDPCAGAVLLHVDIDTEVENVTVAAQTVGIERSIDGGTTWVTLFDDVEAVENDFLDPLPTLNGTNSYRATTVSASPSYFTTAPVDVVTAGEGRWVMLSYGDFFGTTLRGAGDPKVSMTTGRVREAQSFLGRPKPVLFLGANTNRSVSASLALHYAVGGTCAPPDECTLDSPASAWSVLGTSAEVVAYRDYTGRRIFGMVGDIDVTEELWPGHASVSFTVTEVDYTEQYVTS